MNHALLSLEQAKAYLNVDHDADDELIDDLIAEAEGVLSGYLPRALVAVQRTETFDGCGAILFLKHYPVAVAGFVVVDNHGTVDAGDNETLLADTYRLNASQGMLHRTTSTGQPLFWENGVQRFEITYTGGLDQHDEWDAIRAELRQTIRDLVTDGYENRNPSADIEVQGPLRKELDLEAIPQRIKRIWAKYRELR